MNIYFLCVWPIYSNGLDEFRVEYYWKKNSYSPGDRKMTIRGGGVASRLVGLEYGSRLYSKKFVRPKEKCVVFCTLVMQLQDDRTPIGC